MGTNLHYALLTVKRMKKVRTKLCPKDVFIEQKKKRYVLLKISTIYLYSSNPMIGPTIGLNILDHLTTTKRLHGLLFIGSEGEGSRNESFDL